MAAKDEDGNVNADDNQADSAEMDDLLDDISNAVIYAQANPGEAEMISPSGTPRMAEALNARYELIIKESATKAPLKNDPSLPDDEDVVTNSIDYTSSEYDVQRERLRMRFSRLPIENDDDDDSSKELSKIDHPSSSSEHVQYGAQPMPTTQSITPTTAASSPGRSIPSVSMTKAWITSTDFVPKRKQQAMNLAQTQRNPPQQTQRNQQAMNPPQQTQRNQQAMNLPQTQTNPQAMNPHYPQLQVPSGQYGNTTRPPPYFPPPPPALPFEQHGGSNMAHYGTTMVRSPPPYWLPEQNDIHNMPAFTVPYDTMVRPPPPPYWLPDQQNDIYSMPPLDASMVPPGVYVVHYPYGSYPTNSRFGYYEAGASSSHLPPMQHHYQGGDLNAWRPNEQNWQIWDDIGASVDQQNERSGDPSDQTQQRSPPRDN